MWHLSLVIHGYSRHSVIYDYLKFQYVPSISTNKIQQRCAQEGHTHKPLLFSAFSESCVIFLKLFSFSLPLLDLLSLGIFLIRLNVFRLMALHTKPLGICTKLNM